MEGLDLIGGISTIFGFLAVCLAMMWKVVSDKKDTDKVKEMGEKIAKILEYITTEKEGNERKMNELQRQIEQNTKAIGEISEILGKISAKLNKNSVKPHRNNKNDHEN